MWHWFGFKRVPVIGVDIQGTSIQIVELSGRKSAPCLQRYAQIPYTVDSAVSEHLAAAWLRHGFSHRTVAIAVPATSVSTHVFIAPAGLSVDLLELRVYREMRHIFPQPFELYLDFEIRPLARADQVEVFVVASMREPIDRRIAILSAAGLQVIVVDVETYVLERIFPWICLPSITWEAICYMDSAGIHFTVLENGSTHYTRDYRPQSAVSLNAIEMMVEIEKNLALFYEVHTEIRLQGLVLAGESAGLDCAHLSAVLAMPVRYADPFGQMGVLPTFDGQQLAARAPTLVLGTGLALHGFAV